MLKIRPEAVFFQIFDNLWEKKYYVDVRANDLDHLDL